MRVPKRLGLLGEQSRQLGALHVLGETWIVRNLVRGLDLPAGDTLVEDDGLEAGARRVNSGGKSRRSGANHDHVEAL
jgi:hypothetical protein